MAGENTTIHAYSVANLIRFRATRDGVQREFDSWAAAARWVAE